MHMTWPFVNPARASLSTVLTKSVAHSLSSCQDLQLAPTIRARPPIEHVRSQPSSRSPPLRRSLALTYADMSAEASQCGRADLQGTYLVVCTRVVTCTTTSTHDESAEEPTPPIRRQTIVIPRQLGPCLRCEIHAFLEIVIMRESCTA